MFKFFRASGRDPNPPRTHTARYKPCRSNGLPVRCKRRFRTCVTCAKASPRAARYAFFFWFLVFGFWFLVKGVHHRKPRVEAHTRCRDDRRSRCGGSKRRWVRGAWLGAVGGSGATPSRGLRIRKKTQRSSPNRPTAFSLFCTRPPDLDGGMTGARVSRVPRLTSTWDARKGLRIFGRRARVGT